MKRVPETMPLYPSEEMIALKVLGPDRANLWKEIAILDERDGLPHVDPVHGGRYWPAVEKFYHLANNLDRGADDGASRQSGNVHIMDFAPDGEEAPHGPQAKQPAYQRPSSRDRRARA